jgi:hypothetical protein
MLVRAALKPCAAMNRTFSGDRSMNSTGSLGWKRST